MFVAAACSGGGASRAIERMHSWQATIELADTARVNGWVTPRYAQQLRDQARQELDAARQAAGSGRASPVQRDSLTAAADSLEMSLATLERAGP